MAHIFILDDHLLVRDSLASLLTSAGHRVSTFADSQTLFRAMGEDLSAAVICDLTLEGEDGFEVIATLRDLYPSVPLLVLSGSRDLNSVQRCVSLGVSGYLDKLSAGTDAVLDAVAAVLNGNGVFPVEGMLRLSAQPMGPTPPTFLSSLSAREREVLTFISGGADNLKIAAHLGITERTVKAHVSALYRKLKMENRTEMALLAHQHGIRPPRNF